MSIPRISDVLYTQAAPADRETGLLGFVRFTLDGVLRLDGVTLRRSQEGFLYLAFPRRTTASGQYPLMQPTSGEARRQIEQAVLEALGAEEAVP